MPNRPQFLSTLGPSAGERRIALWVTLISLAFFAGAAPFAKVPLAPMPAFLPIYQSALVVTDMITAVLLLGQYAILRSRALLVLAAGYLFGAMMAVAHALSFPGLFTPTGFLGAGPQTTAWLYFLWHGGFPLFVIGYALLNSREREGAAPAGVATQTSVLPGVAAAIGAAVLLTLLATAGHDYLPTIMVGNADAPLKAVVATATWMFGVAAVLVLWRHRARSMLDMWLLVVLVAWSADSALAAVLNHGRYDVGWYAGRIYGLLANSFVLMSLLLEGNLLYVRLAEANARLRTSGDALTTAVTQLETANRDLNRFAGGVAHDLQQPVLSIMGYAHFVSKHAAHLMAPADAEKLQRITDAAQHANRMIEELLQFARLGQEEIEAVPVDLNRVVEHARKALARELESKAVACRVAPLPVVQGDEALLSLVFVNLLSNGIKYSRTREQPMIEIDCAVEEAGGRTVQIRDNGVGFDMAHATRLFTPFERLHSAREFEGTGMGLANVRRIMERHGGSVRGNSSPGQGATFTLSFPA
jgi:signal transduction histidine kinase